MTKNKKIKDTQSQRNISRNRKLELKRAYQEAKKKEREEQAAAAAKAKEDKAAAKKAEKDAKAAKPAKTNDRWDKDSKWVPPRMKATNQLAPARSKRSTTKPTNYNDDNDDSYMNAAF